METIGNYENLQHDEVCVFKYKTIDDTTRVGILLNDATGYNMADFWIYCATGATITVTHADGTVLTHLGADAYHNFSHDYTGWTAFDTGEIVIDTDGSEGSYYFAELLSTVGGSSSDIQDCVQYIYMSDYIETIPPSFLRFSSIKNLLTSNLISDIDGNNYVIQNTCCLSTMILPENTPIPYAFGRYSNLEYIIIRGTTIANVALQEANNLKFVSIYGVTSIVDYFLGSASSLEVVVFNMTTPPTVSGANVLVNIPKSSIIYVPLASLTAYKTNTNMTHLADQMVGV